MSLIQETIKDLQASLKSYSKGLAKQNLLVDIPWTMVDGELNVQRLIFRKDNSLYIVKDGDVYDSKWEYIPSMQSIILEIGGKKTLMNEVYSDGKALILKKDGTDMSFIAFANQNELPELNIIGHLNSLSLTQPSESYQAANNEEGTKVDEAFDPFIVTLVIFVALMIFLIIVSSQN